MESYGRDIIDRGHYLNSIHRQGVSQQVTCEGQSDVTVESEGAAILGTNTWKLESLRFIVDGH
jgi:hypothetical protein